MNGTTVVAGKFGNTRNFNGSDSDYIAVSNDDKLNANTAISVTLWFKVPTVGANYKGLIGKNTISDWNSNQAWSFNFPGNGKIEFVLGSGSALTSNTYDDNTWHHLVGTWNGDNPKIYIDGSEVSYTSQTSTNAVTDSTSELRLGDYAFEAGQNRHLNGTLDDVRIYNRSLSPSEVSALYNFAPGPVAYYDFEDATGSTLLDRSGVGNTGVWNGTGSSHWKPGKFGTGGNFNGG